MRSTLRLAAVTTSIILGLAIATSIRANSQQQPQPQNAIATTPAFEFDVVSVKQSKSAGGGYGLGGSLDGFTATNAPLMMVIKQAYGIFNSDRIIVGAANWVNTERYDIAAKMDGAEADELQKLNLEQRGIARQHMLQMLLAERFKLRAHREIREVSVYSLLIAKNGPKFQESKSTDTNSTASNGRGGNDQGITAGRGSIKGRSVALGQFSEFLALQVGRPVLDRTGLTRLYDLTLQWTPDDNQSLPQSDGASNGRSVIPPVDPNGPSLFTAIQEQLGLKLESGKGPVEVIVIDHIERPSGN